MSIRALNGLIGTFAFEKLTIPGSSTPLTSTVYNKADVLSGAQSGQVVRKIAKFATITVETDQIRYRLDGTDPDATTGHLLNVGDALYLNSEDDIRKFRAIRVTNSATIQVSYA